MNIIVQKYGGSSVADINRINNVARRIITSREKGYKVVTVVSAMGDTTDKLKKLAEQLTKDIPPREYDMLLSTGEQISIALLAIALHKFGYKAISFNAYQLNIITDGIYTKARILKIDTQKLLNELKKDKIVIVAGFQGITKSNELTTLGRGGSDTTAVAIYAALKKINYEPKLCEIYTDVEGVYTADPRIVKEARKLDTISYDEMLELSSLGAKVLHPRAVELAKEYKVKLVVRSSFTNAEGTLITND